MKTILSLAHPLLVNPACRTDTDMIRIGPYPGENLRIWGIEEILKGVDTVAESGKTLQVRLPVYPRSKKEQQEINFLLKKLAQSPQVELVVGAWHQILLEIPNPKVAGENLNVTNSEEVLILRRWNVKIISLPPRWSSDGDDFWKNVPESTCFECRIGGPAHAGWICFKNDIAGDLIPFSPYEKSPPLTVRRRHVWSKYPVNQNRHKMSPSIERGIIECWTEEDLAHRLS